MPEAVIVDCLRTAVAKAPRGALKNTRPDDLAATVFRALLARHPEVAAEDGKLRGDAGCHLRQRFVVSRALTVGTIPVHRLGQTFPQTGRGLESEVSLRF